jgi:RsmE family RNA methyltransferase
MNRILFTEQEDSYDMDPSDPRFEHVRGVLRMGEGDVFDVGVVNGPVGRATIIELDKKRLRVAVTWGKVPSLPPPVYLLVGLCRPATARKILLTAPTLGVRGIFFVHSGRSDPAYSKASLWKADEWRDLVIKGSEQAFDTHVPDVFLCERWEDLQNFLPVDAARLALDVYEGARPLSSYPLIKGRSTILAIGPERGWNTDDRRELARQQFELVSLNDRVLRVETAVTVGLTLVLRQMGIY